jgi:transcriptional regulator
MARPNGRAYNSSMGRYDSITTGDAARLVDESPLAWVVSGTGADFRATLLPLRPVLDAERRVTHLVGHFARGNDQYRKLLESPRAAILFVGPNGYISPSWMRDRTRAPTWNYASVQFLVEVAFFDDPERLHAHLVDLTRHVERGRPDEWAVEETAERYEKLLRGIAGFEARVVETREKFKLGQDERDSEFTDIMAALDDDALRRWMADFNPGRTT